MREDPLYSGIKPCPQFYALERDRHHLKKYVCKLSWKIKGLLYLILVLITFGGVLMFEQIFNWR
jgi:hypothetical protein